MSVFYRFKLRISLVLLLGALLLTTVLGGTQTAFAINTIQVVDGINFDMGKFSSLALDANGNPVISYWDEGNDDLRLARCLDTSCASVVLVTLNSPGNAGVSGSSLALDANGNPVISYMYTSSTGPRLKLMHCDDPYCLYGGESNYTVDDGCSLCTPDATGWESSLVLDANGNPVISYLLTRDAGNGSSFLRLARCGDPDCFSRTIHTVDSLGVGNNSPTSLELDAAGNPVISYFDFDHDDVMLAHCLDLECTDAFKAPIVNTVNDAGRFTSLELDANGNPIISYTTDRSLMLAFCNDPNCANFNESHHTVDGPGVSGSQVGGRHSLQLDADGDPVISYFDEINLDLKLARCVDTLCLFLQTVDSAGHVGESGSSLVLDANGNPVISYYDKTNQDLKLAHCDTFDCRLAHDLLAVGTGYGGGTLTGSGIACAYNNHHYTGDCFEKAPNGLVYSIVAAPDANSSFHGWTGCDLVTTTNPNTPDDTCHVTMTSNRNVYAEFRVPTTEMHVDHIEPNAVQVGSVWYADATIAVVEDNGFPLSGGLMVNGTWRYGPSGQKTVSCITDSAGTCTVPSLRMFWEKVTFTVTSVTGGSLPYNPADNLMTSVDVCRVEGGYCE